MAHQALSRLHVDATLGHHRAKRVAQRVDVQRAPLCVSFVDLAVIVARRDSGEHKIGIENFRHLSRYIKQWRSVESPGKFGHRGAGGAQETASFLADVLGQVSYQMRRQRNKSTAPRLFVSGSQLDMRRLRIESHLTYRDRTKFP